MSTTPENLIKFTCQRCGKVWYEDPEELNKEYAVFKGVNEPRQVVFRSKCPRCGTANVVTAVEED